MANFIKGQKTPPIPNPATVPIRGFRPPIHMRERICAFGENGTGKTAALLDIIKLNRATGGDAQLYHIESDWGSMDRMLGAPTSRFTGIRDRVHLYQVETWEEWVNATEAIRAVARPHDWVGVDFVTDAWEAVQRYYTQVIKGDVPENYFLEHKRRYEERKAALLKAGKPGEVKGEDTGYDGTDWKVIKTMYDTWWVSLYGRMRPHLFLIARERDLREKFHPDDKTTQAAYKGVGVVPKGEGKLANGPDTVCHMSTNGRGAFYMTTLKDRERVLVRNADMDRGFARVYLQDVAGWVLR